MAYSCFCSADEPGGDNRGIVWRVKLVRGGATPSGRAVMFLLSRRFTTDPSACSSCSALFMTLPTSTIFIRLLSVSMPSRHGFAAKLVLPPKIRFSTMISSPSSRRLRRPLSIPIILPETGARLLLSFGGICRQFTRLRSRRGGLDRCLAAVLRFSAGRSDRSRSQWWREFPLPGFG